MGTAKDWKQCRETMFKTHSSCRKRSRSFRRRFMDIMRQVRFSMRSALGNWVLVLLYSFQIWTDRGSFRCRSSGASWSRQLSKKLSVSRPLRAAESEGDRSSLLSMVEAEVSEWMADDEPEGMSQYMGWCRTCLGEDEGEMLGWSGSSESEPPRSCWDAICAVPASQIHALVRDAGSGSESAAKCASWAGADDRAWARDRNAVMRSRRRMDVCEESTSATTSTSGSQEMGQQPSKQQPSRRPQLRADPKSSALLVASTDRPHRRFHIRSPAWLALVGRSTLQPRPGWGQTFAHLRLAHPSPRLDTAHWLARLDPDLPE